MSESEFTDDREQLLDNHKRMYSRDEVLKCPHMMNLLGYLNLNHGLPKSGWLNDGLRYHYTDASGLLGIIQSSRLWASDIRFLNDPSEGTFFPERLLAIMDSQSSGRRGAGQKVIEGLKASLQNPRSDYSAFCVSLSANGDLLSQWRAYGSFGKGYAVGLDFGLKSILPHPQLAGYYDVVYGDKGLVDIAIDLLDLFISATDKWKDMMYDEWSSTLRAIAKSFKDASYSEEQESRLVCHYSGEDNDLFKNELPLKFRAKGSDLIPYIPLSLDLLEAENKPRLPMKRIVVGPGVDFKRNYASINSLLKVNSYADVEVVPSTIPFRP